VYLLDVFILALHQKVRLILFDGLEPLAVLLNEVEDDGGGLVAILVGVRRRLAVGQVPDLGRQCVGLLLEIYANSENTNERINQSIDDLEARVTYLDS